MLKKYLEEMADKYQLDEPKRFKTQGTQGVTIVRKTKHGQSVFSKDMKYADYFFQELLLFFS